MATKIISTEVYMSDSSCFFSKNNLIHCFNRMYLTSLMYKEKGLITNCARIIIDQPNKCFEYSQHSSIIWPVWLNGLSVRLWTEWLWFRVQQWFQSSKEFFDIEANIECGFTLKRVRDMIRTYSQVNRTDKNVCSS